MNIRARLFGMESVEDLFGILDVPFDSKVLSVHRMRILRRFGREAGALVESTTDLPEDALKLAFASVLRQIYEQCARGMREPEPVFRGVAPQLVQLGKRPRMSGEETVTPNKA